MHEMQTIVTDVHGVCLSVCLPRMHRITPHGEAGLRLCSTVRGHSVQSLPNHFGLLLGYYIHRFRSTAAYGSLRFIDSRQMASPAR